MMISEEERKSPGSPKAGSDFLTGFVREAAGTTVGVSAWFAQGFRF